MAAPISLSGPKIHPTPTRAVAVKLARPVVRVSNPTDVSVRRCSAKKFRELVDYCEQVSFFHVTFVLLLTPLPGVVVAVLPALLPLQAPQLGYNLAFFFHAAFVDFSCSLGIILIWCSVTEIPLAVYSRYEALAVSLINTAFHIPLLYATARFWRYPIPFAWVIFALVFLVTLPIAHLVVLRHKIWSEPAVIRSIRIYAASMLFQSSQILVYPAFTVLYDRVSNSWRVALTLLFPMLKYVMRRILLRLSRQLGDHAAEVTVCGVEICAALYQSMILQASSASIGIPFIIGVDLFLSLAVIKLVFDRHAQFSRPHDRLMDTASDLIHRFNVASQTDLTQPVSHIPTTPAIVSSRLPTAIPNPAEGVVSLREAHSPRTQTHHLMIQHALEMAFLAEEVVLVEYVEVIVPLLNLLFLLLTARLPSAQFNPRLVPFFEHDTTFLLSALGSIGLYSLLQAASLVAMHFVLQHRYGISAFKLLAFSLERHRTAIVATLIVWPPFILHFPVVQYGALSAMNLSVLNLRFDPEN